jgi:hypothetical protein
MFKYIESILSKFSVEQRVLALFLLLFFISLIYLGPKFLDSFNPDNEKLENKLSTMEMKLSNLEDEIEQKSTLLRNERLSCTNQILEREAQFIKMLNDLEFGVNKIRNDQVNLERIKLFSYQNIILDTVSQYPTTEYFENTSDSKTDDYVLDVIKKYKSELKNGSKSKK